METISMPWNHFNAMDFNAISMPWNMDFNAMEPFQCHGTISMPWNQFNAMKPFQCHETISMPWNHFNAMEQIHTLFSAIRSVHLFTPNFIRLGAWNIVMFMSYEQLQRLFFRMKKMAAGQQ
ncbi:hypothetical protein QZH41_009433 [Actinostola sp. cb2023]|nr:hypothetical protein QZH41_009433 [Actinostola sp. cb2023]